MRLSVRNLEFRRKRLVDHHATQKQPNIIRHGHLLLQGRRIAVITYTNAARDEIARRLQNGALVEVSTIHSFAWALIKGCTEDRVASLSLLSSNRFRVDAG